MSLGTLAAQVLSVFNLPVRSADNPTLLRPSAVSDVGATYALTAGNLPAEASTVYELFAFVKTEINAL